MKFAMGWTLLTILVSPLLGAAEIKVATMHPLLADLARQIGGEHVEVVELVGADADPHKFEPGPKELQAAKGADVYLLIGKGFEAYQPKLASIVGADRLMEVGARLPTLKAEVLCDHGDHAHAHEEDDPHWWHSLNCWRRAARGVAAKFGELDPDRKAVYSANAKTVRSKLGKLRKWVEAELARVPAEQRTLATAHAAFAYLCNEYKWRSLPVQGLNREQVASPKFVGEVAATIRKEKVGAIFPELRSNPKMLKTLAETVGVKVGDPLIADGSESIEGMFRHNVTAIVKALAPVAK